MSVISERAAGEPAQDRSDPMPLWIQADTLDSLAEINDHCLDLLCEESSQCCVHTAHPLLADLRDLWSRLDKVSRRRAASCPYLVVDAGFIDARRWESVQGIHTRQSDRQTSARFFHLPRSVDVLRLVLTYAWHLSRSQNSAARLLMGMSSQGADLIASCTLRQIIDAAQAHPDWLQPRWPGHLRVWREWLTAALKGNGSELHRMRTRGLQLLATEVRTGRSLYVSPFG